MYKFERDKKFAQIFETMNFRLYLIATVIIVDILREESYGIYLPKEKFLGDDASKKVRNVLPSEDFQSKIPNLIPDDKGTNMYDNSVMNSKRVVGESMHATNDSSSPTDTPIKHTTVIVSENPPTTEQNFSNDESVLEESAEEMEHLDTSIESMKSQLLMQPSYQVIDVHKQDAAFDVASQQNIKDFSNTVTMAAVVWSPNDQDTIQVNSDRPKITDTNDAKHVSTYKKDIATIPKNSNENKNDTEDENTARSVNSESNSTGADDSRHKYGTPVSTDNAVEPKRANFADCDDTEHEHVEHHELVDSNLMPLESEELSEKKFHKTQESVMESKNMITEFSVPVTHGEVPYESTTSTLSPPLTSIGQKEFAMENVQWNGNDLTDVDEETASQTARTLATNVMAALIRYDERQCALGVGGQCDQSTISGSVNVTEHVQTVSPNATETTGDEPAANREIPSNASDGNMGRDNRKEEKDISFLEKIILGIRCARQDCRDTLISRPSSESQSDESYQKRRRPVTTNWTIMRMKRFRHQFGYQANASDSALKRNDHFIQDDAAADVSRLLDILASCECRVTRMQRNFLRRMMFDNTVRARVINGLKEIISNNSK